MTSSNDRRPSYSRRFIVFAALIVLVVVGYSLAWNHFAGLIASEANATVAALNRDGRRASCEGLDVRGYPFRFGVFCHSTMYVDARGGVAVRAGSLRSAAQVYNPSRAVVELDGPATVEVPGLNALDVGWDALRASLRIGGEQLQRLSVEAAALRIDPDGGPIGEAPLVTAEKGEFHMRPNGADADVALRFSGLAVAPQILGDGRLPALDGTLDAILAGAMARQDWSGGLRGLSGELRNASLSGVDGAGISARGPFSVDQEGVVDAELDITVQEPEVLARLIGDLFPTARNQIAMGLGGLSTMGEDPVLPLRISRGQMRIGFITLGTLPPL